MFTWPCHEEELATHECCFMFVAANSAGSKNPLLNAEKKIGRVITSLYAKDDHAVTAITEGSVQQIGQTNNMNSFFLP